LGFENRLYSRRNSHLGLGFRGGNGVGLYIGFKVLKGLLSCLLSLLILAVAITLLIAIIF
jgi:hypothetical protein